MAVPKKKTSHSRKKMRNAGSALKPINIVFDSTTGEPKLPHHVSLKDNTYKGRVVVKEAKSQEENTQEKSAE